MRARFLTRAVDHIFLFLKISKTKTMVWKCREKYLNISKGLLFVKFSRPALCLEIISHYCLESFHISRFKQIGKSFSNFKITHSFLLSRYTKSVHHFFCYSSGFAKNVPSNGFKRC